MFTLHWFYSTPETCDSGNMPLEAIALEDAQAEALRLASQWDWTKRDKKRFVGSLSIYAQDMCRACWNTLESAWVDPMPAVNCMYAGYVKAFLWAEVPLSMDEGDEGSDASLEDLGYTPYQLDPDAVRSIRSDCAKLFHLVTDSGANFPADLWEQVGMDLYFTRQGHGTGFWDRPELYGKELAERLTQLVHENFKPVSAVIDNLDYIQVIEG